MNDVLEHFSEYLKTIENKLERCCNDEDIFRVLGAISPDLFALLVWRKQQLTELPNLHEHLIELPAVDVQKRFAGGSGEELLPRATFFVNYLKFMLSAQIGLTNVRMIDYGCGWGRITRLLPVLTQYKNIIALDPNAEVLSNVRVSKHIRNIHQIDPVPDGLPIDGCAECVFLFSIFTHTPPELTRKIAQVIRERLHDSGILVVTIRPKAFWHYLSAHVDPCVDTLEMMRQHEEFGYAFKPQPSNPHYGDVSYSEAFFVNLLDGYDLVDRTFTILDPFQIYLTFKKER